MQATCLVNAQRKEEITRKSGGNFGKKRSKNLDHEEITKSDGAGLQPREAKAAKAAAGMPGVPGEGSKMV